MENVRTSEEQQATLQQNTQMANQAIAVFDAVMEETKRPMELQWNFLKEILEDNKDTEYGKKHHFSDITSIEDYKKNIPIAVWEDFEPYVDRMMEGEKNVLTAYDFDHFNLTSGTAKKPKHMAYTKKHEDSFAKYNSLCAYGLLAKTIGLSWCGGRGFLPNTGKTTKLPSGITEGHTTAKIVDYFGGEKADRMLRTLFTSPIEASLVEQGKDTNYIHCRFALEDQNVTGINVMYFPFLLGILKYMDNNLDLLIHDIETGEIDQDIEIPKERRDSLMAKIKPLPERAKELKEIFKNGHDFPYLPAIWPNLEYVFGCSGGGFTNYDRYLREHYTGDDLTRIYYGITATEGVFSIPFKEDSVESVLTAGSVFMEFRPTDGIDDNDMSVLLTMDQLEVGKQYELIVTNGAGLYRYRMYDAVEVTGWLNKTPTVKFIGRVNKMINMTAEKVQETNIEDAVKIACSRLNTSIFDFCVYPNYEKMRYQFLVEPEIGNPLDVEAFKDELQKIMLEENESYYNNTVIYKRLNPLDVQLLQQGTCLLYREIMQYKGSAASTIKPVHVITTDFQQQFFTKLVNE